MNALIRITFTLLALPLLLAIIWWGFTTLPWYLAILVALVGIGSIAKRIKFKQPSEEDKARAKAEAMARLDAMPAVEKS